MNRYDYWFDADGKPHEISQMDEGYINNCLKELRKWSDAWGGVIPEQLTDEELREKDSVGSMAWFVFDGITYIDAFIDELNRRNETCPD